MVFSESGQAQAEQNTEFIENGGEILDGIKVEFPVSVTDDGVTVVTAPDDVDWSEVRAAQILRSALENFDGKMQSSVIPNDTTNGDALTLARIDELAQGLNSNLDNLITVNAIILCKVLEDSYFGEAAQAVISNINSDYRLTYGCDRLTEEDAEELKTVQQEIDYWARCIQLPQLIRDAISRTYMEGNAPIVMRTEKGSAPVVEILSLQMAYPSEYRLGGRSVIEFDVKKLKDRLAKTYKKTKKNKPVYYENIEADVKANFRAEVYKGYKDNESYVKLDPRYSDCVKVNDFGRRFGVSPLFRCLRPLVVLEQIEEADVSDTKARKKKILHQKTRKEILGPDGSRQGLDRTVYAHQQLMKALQTPSCVVTTPAWVEDLQYVQLKNVSEHTINQQKLYTQKMLTGLGITFTDVDATLGVANIGVAQLLKIVNSIGESLEGVLNKLMETYVVDNGHDAKFAPTIKVIDSEQLAADMRRELASFVYNTLNFSLETTCDIIGLDVQDEVVKRKKENEEGYDKIFFPRETAYTSSSRPTGRPAGDDENGRQDYDKTYTKVARE